MSLNKRILAQLPDDITIDSDEYYDGFAHGSYKAATLASEADELMREMESAIDGLIGMYAHKHCDEAMKSDECHSACEVLERYNNWGEKIK